MRLIWIAVGVVMFVACAQTGGEPGVLLQSNKQRQALSQLAAVDMTAQTKGYTQFAFDVYQQLKSTPGNLLFSPISISTALTMVYAGANGETANEMAKTLHLPSNTDVHAAANKLDLELSSRGKNARGADGGPLQLSIANALFPDAGFEPTIKSPFLDQLAVNYGAGLHLVDFAGATEASRQAINAWISKNTKNRINDLIPQGSLTSDTAVVLTNAVYLNAAWESQFEPNDTYDSAFHVAAGEITVPMMNQTNLYSYSQGTDYQAIELPYDGHELSMLIILPRGTLEEIEGSLNAERWQEIVNSLEEKRIYLQLPKFGFDFGMSANETLQSLGMTSAFDRNRADFTGIADNPGRPLYIGNVLHKAFIKVAEKGTEAAAATVVELTAGSAAPIEITDMFVNKPFVFAIRDIQTGALLFLGRVTDPR